MNNRKLPIGVQSFEKIRMGNYLYIDKTEFIWNLVNNGTTYFLSRPRRFGKSLLTSTIAAYFQGEKELFKGLAIEAHENEKGEDAWQKYPVISFSLASGEYNTDAGLYDVLSGVLEEVIEKYELKGLVTGRTLSRKFREVIRNLYRKTGKQVVVLIDEYDKPLLDTMTVNKEQEDKNRQLYSDFFSALKDEDQYIKFSFITGVTKFAKVSVFSGLNQPKDISLTEDYACICGITEEEMKEFCQPEIEAMAQKRRLTKEECFRKLEKMYDGYHFSIGPEGVYNPFSLFNAFQDKTFGRYWFSTGTPSFLIKMLEDADYTSESISDGITVTEYILRDYRGDETDPIPLAYQAGYLTIKEYDEENDLYILGFPNEEVEYGYLNVLAPSVFGGRETDRVLSLANMTKDLRNGEIEQFMNRLEAFFASMPYIEGKTARYEQFWQREIYLIFKLMGERVQCQPHTAIGRADCVVETKEYVYIFEFKVDRSKEEALEQIEKSGYAHPYKADPRKIYEIGVSFSSAKRNIADWKCD